MNMSITQPAAKWYMEEMDLSEGDFVRFFVRYGGHGGIHKGFSLAISNDKPNDPALQTEEQGVTFYVENSDLWYFDGKDFHIKYSRKHGEIEYIIS
ncbi:HesB/YadR/YfhF family protein [Aquibacillus koreensis]|uniref:HesB/YadR/YfhF family protein n=1 Tax=Aquibacillus koreensis TaxID=279446 RepID=A0A9X3WPS1_9BACI|nr:HesB/YadR/YfhF family protein [Aquibacillus koreensis]MCT2537768.1 HesB/YadR/YfhF family protein [Aquibacillus koreensis]MDC3421199.1 HesB/YadR/YfhF family protein [Aquibacillus koreensis]